jgi:hypothetical protein
MARYYSYSGSDTDPYGYDLTLSDEEQLIAVVDSLSPPAPRRTRAEAQASISARVPPTTPSKSRSSRTVSRDAIISPPDSTLKAKAAQAVHEALQDINERDLNFDINELNSEAFSHDSGSDLDLPPRRAVQPPAIQRWLAPTVSSDNRSVASSSVSQTKARSTASVLSAAPSVHYPDPFSEPCFV